MEKSKAFPKDAELAHLLGQCYEANAQYPQAVAYLTQAVKQDPKQIRSYVLLADVLARRLDDSRQADSIMDDLIKANGKSAEAYLARQIRFDPDVWIVESEDRAGRHFLDRVVR